MKKRILSFVLALLMMVSTVPAPVFAADGGEAAPVAETEAAPTTETTAPTEPSTEPSTEPVCATCGANGCTSEHLTWCPECKKDDCGVDHVSAAEVDPCATCGNEVCTCGSTEPACTVCGETGCTKEHKTCETCGTMDCTADHTNWCDTCKKDNCGVDHAAELPRVPMTSTGPKQETSAVADEVHPMVGKIVTLNTEWPTAIPDVNNVSNGNMTSAKAYPEHMEIEAVATVNNVGYYQLKAAPGYTWPDYVTDMNAGTTVNYEHYWIEASKVKLVEENCPVCGKPGCTAEHIQCDKCGEYDCTRLHFWCDRCNKYDCGKSHLICRVCDKVDCTEKHVFCGYCNSYDSCPGHDFSPVTTPVIPANPEMTPGADVSIVDENGSAITGTNGLVIREGTKTSISAWTDLTGNIDYQWQICYDDENDLWTNIQGQTGKGILISPAMVNSVIELTGSAMIRCRITSGTTVQYSADIPVEVVQNASASMNRYGLARTARNTALYADAPELSSYTVVINYVYEDNAPAADSYTATLAAGSSFSATVPHPNVMGYLPFIGVEEESSTSLLLDIENIQADVTYTVTYKPTNVNYTVFHYHQNLNDNGYTIAATETKQGLTNSQVPEEAVAKDYPGFVSLLYERPTIAADGSTEVEIYYDREYYLMIFNLGEGGYGVEPIYARYGAPVEIGTPKRPGYTFDGWSPTVPTTVPVDGGRYTAQWISQQTTYTIVYWKENADDSNYSYWGQESKTASAGSTVSGSDSIPTSITTTTVDGKSVNERPYFTYNAAKTDSNVVVKGNGSTVVNVYYYRNTYSVYFTGVSGKCAIEEHTHGTNCNSYLDCLKSEHAHDKNCTTVLTCTQSEHTHVDDCTDLTCILSEHSEHTDDCLICNKTVHERHTDNCCTITSHTHSASCCTILPHAHSKSCCELTEHEHSFGCLFGGCPGYEHSHNDGDCSCNQTAHTHGVGSCTCATPEHVHGGSSCTCDTEIHYHSEDQGCYSDKIHQHNTNCYGLTCGYMAHTHVDACYMYTCGGEEHDHTDSCYRPCTKLEHTHHTRNCNNNSDDNVIYVVTAKYEQTIGDIWPTAANFPNITFRGWSIDGVDATATSKRVNMTSDLCDTGDKLKYAEAVEGGNKKYLYYMFESFDQSSPANGNERIRKNGVYYDKSELYYQEVNSGSNWNQKEIAGMAPVSNGVSTSGSNVFLYYNRNRSNLMYHNVTGVVKTVTSIMYEQPLANYKDSSGNLLSDYVPSYPNTLEPNAYEFAGWYTTPECYEGTEFDFSTATMPNGDLTLYAKWAPVDRTVTFYLDKKAMENGTKLYPDQTTPHGSLLRNPVADPVNGDYEFVGWFYMDGEEEKAFLFPTMVITKDMKVYGKWSSNVPKEYTVYFKIQGTDTQIADPITGSGIAGHTKTFNAKVGNDLYTDYQEGYFPLVKSHSMTLDIENEANNTFTFWYVQKEAVPYTVYYVAETLKEDEIATEYKTITRDGKTYFIIAPTKGNEDNRKAVVTEKFEPVSGYMPDAYQKRLVVDGTEGAVNEIIFYYSVDSVHAYYKITHYTKNTDGEHWTEYASSEVQGEIGKTYSASPLTIPGFTYDPRVAGTVTSGELTADGLELKLYYVRNPYPYEVRYLERGTGIPLADPKKGTGLYGAMVSESAIPIENYIAADPTSQTLTIRIEESQTEAKLNIITFYYTENEATINYVAVGNGGVAPSSETLKVLTGVAQGSTATTVASHRFVGWYSDEACTVRISEDAKYVPTKAEGATWIDGTTYYAKFEPNAADLKITKSGWQSIDENQTFIFDVMQVIDGKEKHIVTVTINGNGSVTIKDLPIGQYKVTERTDWSWRYTPKNGNVRTVNLAEVNEVVFENQRTGIYWLSGDNFNENQFNPND